MLTDVFLQLIPLSLCQGKINDRIVVHTIHDLCYYSLMTYELCILQYLKDIIYVQVYFEYFNNFSTVILIEINISIFSIGKKKTH